MDGQRSLDRREGAKRQGRGVWGMRALSDVNVKLLYADDILLLAPSITLLEILLHDCEYELNWLDMTIWKSFCLLIGQRHDVSCAGIISLSGQIIPWTTEIR